MKLEAYGTVGILLGIPVLQRFLDLCVDLRNQFTPQGSLVHTVLNFVKFSLVRNNYSFDKGADKAYFLKSQIFTILSRPVIIIKFATSFRGQKQRSSEVHFLSMETYLLLPFLPLQYAPAQSSFLSYHVEAMMGLQK